VERVLLVAARPLYVLGAQMVDPNHKRFNLWPHALSGRLIQWMFLGGAGPHPVEDEIRREATRSEVGLLDLARVRL